VFYNDIEATCDVTITLEVSYPVKPVIFYH